MDDRYRVMFHIGPELNAATIASQGFAQFAGSSLTLSNHVQSISVPGSDIRQVTFYHFAGVRVMKIAVGERQIYLSAIRLMIGQLALGNYFRTKALFDHLVSIAPDASVVNETLGAIGWRRRLARIAILAIFSFCGAALASMALSYFSRP